MAEGFRGNRGQPESSSSHEIIATHTILPGASIKVNTMNGYTWAVVVDGQFTAMILPKTEEAKHEKSMRFFEAVDPFTVYYPRHQSRARKEAGTRLYAFPNPQDHLVRKIPKTKGK